MLSFEDVEVVLPGPAASATVHHPASNLDHH
jgi:hypothetical protein